MLDPITVEAASPGVSSPGYQGAPDWVYETPAGVSVMSREAIRTVQPRDAGDLFTGMSGVSVASDAQNPGISINVRGLQDQNRVTATIDGARQNFQQSGHGQTSSVYVDTALLRAVEVEKNAAVGVGSGGSHGAVVNFRTLTTEDILRPGETLGGEVDATVGSNAYEFYGSGAVAARPNDDYDVVAAVSHKKLGAYDIGQNGTVELSQYARDSEAVFTGSETWSGLFKIGADLTDTQRLVLGLVAYDSEFTTSVVDGGQTNDNHVRNLTGTLTHSWKPGDPLFDLTSQLWYTRTENEQFRTARNNYGAFDVDYAIVSHGASTANISRLEVPYGKLALRYGLEGFRDQTDTVSTGSAGASADGSVWFSGTNPVGERTLASGFSEATFTHDTWLEISAGGRYDHYDLSGLSSVRYCRKPVIIRGRLTCANVDWVYRETDVEQSDGRFSPTATLAITPVTGLQLFGKYSEGYRPGTLAETVLGGAHIGNLFYYAPNPDLKPEQSQTWEAGANLLYNDVLKDGDKFRMKAVYFDRTMRDFIALGQVSGDPFGTGLQTSFFQYVNLLGDTEMKGVEIEANYEARDFYIGASFTYNNALYAQDYNVNPWGNATGNPTGLIYYLFVAPEYKFTVDAGIRMLDEHLTLGVRVTHIVPSEQIGLNSITYAPSEYTTLDLYGSYKFDEQAALRFSVNNVTDIAYVDPLSTYDFPAPGRTASVSLQIKF